MYTHLSRCACTLLALTLIGCASSAPAARDTSGAGDFPSRAELLKLSNQRVEQGEYDFSRKMVDRWRLTGPLSDVISYRPREAAGELEERVVAAAKAAKIKQPQVTDGATCYARELGVFYLEHEERPHEGLESFMTSRCGMAAARPMHYIWDVSAPAPEDNPNPHGMAPDQLAQLARILDRWTQEGESYELGIWRGERDGKKIVTLAMARRYVELEPLSAQAGADGTVELRGEALHDRWDKIDAAYTVSDFDLEYCEADESVKPPRFVLRCKLNRGDRDTRLDLWASREERVLGYGVTDLVLWPQIAPQDTYTAPQVRALINEAKLDEAAPLLDQVLALVNPIRAARDLPPLRGSEAQTRMLGKLAPHIFEAEDSEDGDALQDRLARGVQAGWELGEPILGADWTSGHVQRRDVRQWLSALLERSSGRRTLLSAREGVLSLGVYPRGDAYSIIACTYRTPPRESYAARLARFARFVNRSRARHKLPGIMWSRDPENSEDLVRDVEAGAISWEEARLKFRDRVRYAWPARSGLVWRVPNIDVGDLADVWLDLKSTRMDAMIAILPKANGHPWHEYVISFVTDKPPEE